MQKMVLKLQKSQNKFAKIRSKAVEFNYMPQANRPTLALVEEKFREENFSGEPRDARKKHGIWPYFGRISSKIDVKSQN